MAQVVWGAVIFLALYLLLSRWALPKATAVLEKRADTIAADLDAARMAMARGRRGGGGTDRGNRQGARRGAERRSTRPRDQAKQAAAAQAADAEAKLEARLAEAETQIDQARAAAMASVHQVATETAAAVFSRLTGQSPDPGRLDAAVGAALAARAR